MFSEERVVGLTDVRLSQLLERIDGRNHVESISLVDCPLCDGTGLLPLVGSTVLKSLDLRRAYMSPTGYQLNRNLTRQLHRLLQPLLTSSPPQLTSLRAYRTDYFRDIKPLMNSPPPHIVLDQFPQDKCHCCVEVMYNPVNERPADRVQERCDICHKPHCAYCVDGLMHACDECGALCCQGCLNRVEENVCLCDNCYEPLSS